MDTSMRVAYSLSIHVSTGKCAPKRPNQKHDRNEVTKLCNHASTVRRMDTGKLDLSLLFRTITPEGPDC